jgi:hypothetical protein
VGRTKLQRQLVQKLPTARGGKQQIGREKELKKNQGGGLRLKKIMAFSMCVQC